jgi:hypothetical protein
MVFEEHLSVITPVSRPENLSLVGSSVPPQTEWILVTDGPLDIPANLRPHRLIQGPRTAQWGDVQRQLGMQAATRRYVYFLDDDNLMLPDLPELVLPHLERHSLAGALFSILAHTASTRPHLWPAPPVVEAGRVDTAMFVGRREHILRLTFNGVAGIGWPNAEGRRHADFLFLRAMEESSGLARLPALYGFHNGIPLLADLEPDLLHGLQEGRTSPHVLPGVLNDYLSRVQVPPWW